MQEGIEEREPACVSPKFHSNEQLIDHRVGWLNLVTLTAWFPLAHVQNNIHIQRLIKRFLFAVFLFFNCSFICDAI